MRQISWTHNVVILGVTNSIEEKFKVSNGNDAIDPNSERYKRMLELERELEGDD